jgi:hypothetical protein
MTSRRAPAPPVSLETMLAAWAPRLAGVSGRFRRVPALPQVRHGGLARSSKSKCRPLGRHLRDSRDFAAWGQMLVPRPNGRSLEFGLKRRPQEAAVENDFRVLGTLARDSSGSVVFSPSTTTSRAADPNQMRKPLNDAGCPGARGFRDSRGGAADCGTSFGNRVQITTEIEEDFNVLDR